MKYETILYEVKDHVLTLTLHRPDNMNAFTVTMANELVHAFERVNTDDSVRAIVVTGSGRAFCAGMDLSIDGNVFGLDESLQPSLSDMQSRLHDAQIDQGVRDTGGKVSLAIYNCTKPVIAAINGAAVGIGASMTCPMDIRLCSETAKIGFVFNKIGIVPEACSSWFLPRIVGIPTALEWCYSGDILDANTVKAAGFVARVCAPDELLTQAYAMAQKIVKHSPVAVALTRQMMYRNSAQPHPIEAHRIDSLAMFYTSVGDGKEGVQSFLEKRPPGFSKSASTDMPDFYPWWADE